MTESIASRDFKFPQRPEQALILLCVPVHLEPALKSRQSLIDRFYEKHFLPFQTSENRLQPAVWQDLWYEQMWSSMSSRLATTLVPLSHSPGPTRAVSSASLALACFLYMLITLSCVTISCVSNVPRVIIRGNISMWCHTLYAPRTGQHPATHVWYAVRKFD